MDAILFFKVVCYSDFQFKNIAGILTDYYVYYPFRYYEVLILYGTVLFQFFTRLTNKEMRDWKRARVCNGEYESN